VRTEKELPESRQYSVKRRCLADSFIIVDHSHACEAGLRYRRGAIENSTLKRSFGYRRYRTAAEKSNLIIDTTGGSSYKPARFFGKYV